MEQREKLIEIIQNSVGGCARNWAEVIADGLIENGIIATPFVAYNKKYEKYQIIHVGKQEHIFASKLYHTKREAERELERRNK